MIASFPTQPKITSASKQARRAQIVWVLWLLGIVGFTSALGLLFFKREPTVALIGWVCFFAGIAALMYQPRIGVYLTIGLALAGDSVLSPWYPFVKNLSSAESLLYIGRATSFSPAEIYIALTFVSWLGRAAMQRKIRIFTGQLFWPVFVFTMFVTFGFIRGFMRHGDTVVALWEVRSIYYLPAMFVLTSNLIQTRKHINCLIWTIILGIFADAVVGAIFTATYLNFDLHVLEAIAEHSYSVHINSLFILMIAVWMYHGSIVKRIVLPLMSPILLLSYFANQRRASYIALAIAIALIFVVIYQENRRLFWVITPLAVCASILYLAVFWNSTGGLGGPARAVRSVIAPQAGSRDDSSNEYRVLENINSAFTIKTSPLFGLGFGQKFYIVAPMPSISFFIWWEYITHNSIMWIWIQTGVGGFLAMLFMIGSSIILGIRTLFRLPGGDMSAFALMAILYIVMHFIFAYVDMSWEAQNMLYIGVMIGLINTFERVAAQPLPQPYQRWPWQYTALSAPTSASAKR